jgi:hypothetical protein
MFGEKHRPMVDDDLAEEHEALDEAALAAEMAEKDRAEHASAKDVVLRVAPRFRDEKKPPSSGGEKAEKSTQPLPERVLGFLEDMVESAREYADEVDCAMAVWEQELAKKDPVIQERLKKAGRFLRGLTLVTAVGGALDLAAMEYQYRESGGEKTMVEDADGGLKLYPELNQEQMVEEGKRLEMRRYFIDLGAESRATLSALEQKEARDQVLAPWDAVHQAGTKAVGYFADLNVYVLDHGLQSTVVQILRKMTLNESYSPLDEPPLPGDGYVAY